MLRPKRLTRRFPAQMTEAGYRRLRKFAEDVDMNDGEALSFLFENFDTVTHRQNLQHRLDLHRERLKREMQRRAMT